WGVEQVDLAALVEGESEGLVAVDVAGIVAALNRGPHQRFGANHSHPGTCNPPESSVLPRFPDIEPVEHPAPYRVEPGAQGSVFARDRVGVECVELLRCRVAR